MKKLRGYIIIFFISATFLFPVKKDTKLVLAELEIIKSSLTVLGTNFTDIKSELKNLNKQITIIDNKISAITKNLADEGQNKETILLSLQFIKEEFNEVRNAIGKINDRLTAMPVASMNTGNAVNSVVNNPTQSPDSIYFTAYSDYNKKNYDLAIEGFKQFVKLFPDNVLADNSLYWIGECYYAQKEYSEAIKIFSDIINKYASGDKVPDALLKKGYALIEMDQVENGISVLKELISEFPLSEEAYLAQQKIKDISD